MMGHLTIFDAAFCNLTGKQKGAEEAAGRVAAPHLPQLTRVKQE